MMIEQLLLYRTAPVPGESVRLIIAFAGVIIATYYDLFNRKNVPDKFLYGFLAVALLTNIVFFDMDIFIFTVAVAAFISAINYVFYRVGQMGGADVIAIAAVALLVPFVPSFVPMLYNMPFIFPTIVFGGVLFGAYTVITMALKIAKQGGRPKLIYSLLLIPYALFAYIFLTSTVFSPVFFGIITMTLLITMFYLMYREDIMMMLAEELPVEQLEPEDVVAFELMDKDVVRRLDLKRVLTAAEIDRLRQEKVASLWVYTQFPPFIPFLLAGMLLAVFFSNSLLFGLAG